MSFGITDSTLPQFALEVIATHKRPGNRETELLEYVSSEGIEDTDPDVLLADLGDTVRRLLKDRSRPDHLLRQLAEHLPRPNRLPLQDPIGFLKSFEETEEPNTVALSYGKIIRSLIGDSGN